MTLQQVMELTDNGQITINDTLYTLYDPDKKGTLLQLPVTRCPIIDWNGKYKDFSPSGPRGWLDEYCEWSIVRDANGDMRKITFTSENPAYFLAMWRIDPNAVLEQLYLSHNQIADLSPLAQCTRLATLHLVKNKIKDVTPLAGLTNLQALILGENKIKDYSALAEVYANLAEKDFTLP